MPESDVERLLTEQKLRQAIAEAEQKTAEAELARDSARRASGSAAEAARRAEEKAQVENRQAVAEARAATIKAYLPEPTTKPLEGKVERDTASGIVAELAAYALLDGAAQAIATQVKQAQVKRVLVVEERSLATTDWPYVSVTEQLGRLTRELDQVLAMLREYPEPAPDGKRDEAEQVKPPTLPWELSAWQVRGLQAAFAPGLVSAVPTLVGAAADVVGFLRSDYSVAGRSFTAKTTPLVAATAGALRRKKVKVTVDGFQSFSIADSTILVDFSDVLSKRWDVTEGRLSLAQRTLLPKAAEVDRRKSTLAAAKDELAAAEKASPKDEQRLTAARRAADSATTELARAERELADVQRLVDIASAVEARADSFATTVTTVPAVGGLPPLGQAVLRERLRSKDNDKINAVLYLGIDSAGGETITRRRLFFAPVIRYVGACQVSAMLVDQRGDISWAGTQTIIGQLTYTIKDGNIGQLVKSKITVEDDNPPA